MALPETPELIIDDSDEQLAGVYVRSDSRSEEAETQIFVNEMKYKRRLRVVRPPRDGILDQVWETVDLTGAEFEYAVGRLNQAPTDGTFDLDFDGSTENLLFLDYNISETDLQAALQSNTTLTAIANFTFSGSQINIGGPHSLGVDLRVRFSSSGTLPSPLVAGTDYYVVEIIDSDSLRVAATEGGSAITLSGGSGTHTIHKTVGVEQIGRLYRVTIYQYAAQDAFTGAAENLSPPSQITIKHRVVGDADTFDVQTIHIVQQPFAFQDTWTLVDPGTVGLTTVSSGDNETPAKYRVAFTEPPEAGMVRFVHSVPQITEIVTTANTATAAQLTLEFAPISGGESDFGGEYVDIYLADQTVRRVWFDYNDLSTAPSAPENGSLVEIDYTSIATLVSDLITQLDTIADFNTPTTLSASKVQVTYAAKGARIPMSIAGAPTLSSLTSKMVTNGSDGIHVGRYLTLPDRNGLNCVHMIGGLTTATTFPDVGDLEINRYIPVTLSADATANAVAIAIAAALDADAEYGAPVPGGNTATVTDAFGGTRTTTVTKTVTFGVAVKRAGFNVSASVPWDLDATAIASKIGNDRYNVSKDNPLEWVITLKTNGAMTTPTLTDESLVWASRVEGTLDFGTEAADLAFAAATTDSITAVEELAYTASGGVRRIIMQRPCILKRNMMPGTGGFIVPPFTEVLTSINTGNVLWVDQVNGDNPSGVPGDLNKSYETITGAKAAATSGDTIVVLPGTYDENNLLKTGVAMYFMPGADITYTGSSTVGIFDDNGSSVVTSVTGHGRFTNAKATGAAPVLKLSHASSAVKFEADFCTSTHQVINLANGTTFITITELTGTTDDAPGLHITGGEHHFNGQRIETGYDGILVGGGTLHASVLYVEGASNAVETTGGTLRLHANYLKSTGEYAINAVGGDFHISSHVIETTAAFPAILTEGCVGLIEANVILGGTAGSVVELGIDTELILKGSRLKAGASSLPAVEITSASAALTVWNCILVAGSSATNSIVSAAATDVRAYASYSNKAVDGNTTNVITGGLTVDADVV